jgi:peptide/nickel transport system permease protein
MDIDLSRIVALDILPNIMPYVAVNFMRSGRRVIFQAIALYYLGVLPYSQDNWGTLLNRAFQQGNIWNWDVSYAFWVPLSAVILLSLGLILLSQSLDAVFNPRVRARHVTDADQPRAETN